MKQNYYIINIKRGSSMTKFVGNINKEQHDSISKFLLKRFSDIEFYKRDGQYFIVKELTDFSKNDEKYAVYEEPEMDIKYIPATSINEVVFKQSEILDDDYKLTLRYQIVPVDFIDGILDIINASKSLKDAFNKIKDIKRTLQ